MNARNHRYLSVSQDAAILLGNRDGRIHYAGADHAACLNAVEEWRPNGRCKTWATRPGEYKLPIKRGLGEFGYVTHGNAHEFHLAEDCPKLAIEREQVAQTMGLLTVADTIDHVTGSVNLDRVVPGWDEEE